MRTLERYSPLVGGVMLLAWTGFGGERTDVLAHVTGFAAGLALGTVLVFVPRTVLERRSVQAVAALASVLILVMAWVVALG